MFTCKAIVDGDRIQLDIRKGDDGYEEFVAALNKMEEEGHVSWYGDIRLEDGTETSGLVLARKQVDTQNE